MNWLDDAIDAGMLGPRHFGRGYIIMSTGEWTGFKEVERDGKYVVYVRTKDEAVSERRN